MSNRVVLIALLFAALVGCSPDDYQKSADLQVDRLVKDREKKTLDYAPQATADVKTSPQLTAKSYDKLPVSPVPPPTTSPMEPAQYGLPFKALGPEMLFSADMPAPRSKLPSLDDVRQPGLERLRPGPPATRVDVTSLDLYQSIAYAVQHSRDYQSQMEDLYLSALDVTLERHLFEPRPFATVGANYTGGQGNNVDYRSALAITSTAGIRQQLPYGGEIVAQGLVDFVRSLNDGTSDGESAQLALNATIPLLRGAGPVNLEPLISSERELVYRVRTFEDFRRAFVVQISSQYFRLLTLQQSIINRRFNYVAAVQLTEQSYAVYAAGRPGTNFVSVQRAEQQLYQAQNAIITAEDSYQSALDDFKQLLGMAVDMPLDVIAVDLNFSPPDLEADVIGSALQYRLDLQTATDRVEDARRSLAVSRNGLLPDLDLTGGASVGNPTGMPARSIDGRTLQYSAGVNLDLPIDRLAERNTYRRSLISLERAQRNLQETRDSIIAQVRDAVRSIRSARATLDIQQRSMDLARKQLDYSNALLVLGRATDSRDSVDAQNNLLNAQDRYEQAKANYQTQILSFLRDTGTLRINPDAGSLGRAMERELPSALQVPH